MKFNVMFKDPDGVSSSLEDAGIVNEDLTTKDGMDDARDLVNKFVEWNEYVYLEFDTDAGTVTVLEAD